MRIRCGYTEYWIGKAGEATYGHRVHLKDSRIAYRLLDTIVSSDALLGILRRLAESCGRAHHQTSRRAEILELAANLVGRGRLEIWTVNRAPQSRVVWAPQSDNPGTQSARPVPKPMVEPLRRRPVSPQSQALTDDKGKKKDAKREDQSQCDVQTLILADSRSKSTLSCSRPRRGSPLLPGVPNRMKSLFQRYDLVLEVISLDNPAPKTEENIKETEESLKERKENPRKTKVKIDRTHLGGCGDHPLVTMSRGGEILHSWKEPPGEHEFPVRHLGNEWFGNGKIGSIFSALVPINRHILQPTDELQVTAHSCGIRAGGSPFRDHQALIRVYDGSKWAISLGTQKARSTTYDIGEHNKKEHDGSPLSKEESRWGTPTEGDDDEESWPIKFTITRDELELECAEALKKLIDRFVYLKKKTKSFMELLKGTPKLGFYGSLDFSIFEGSCEVSCEKSIRMGNSGRHTEFLATYALAIKMRLVEFNVAGAYGAEISSKLYTALIKLELTVGTTADVDFSRNLKLEAEAPTESNGSDWHIPVKTAVIADFGLKAEISIMGRGVKAEGGVMGGLSIKADAGVRFGSTSGLHATINIRRNKTVLHGYYIVDMVVWHTEDCYEKELWDERELLEEKFGDAA